MTRMPKGVVRVKRKLTSLVVLFLFTNVSYISAWAEETSTVDTSSTEQTSQPATSEVEDSTQVSSTDQVTTPSIHVSEPAASEEPTEPSNEPEQEVTSEAPKISALVAVGDGTEANPYRVTTFQELKDALGTLVAVGQTQYIQLQNDIVYNATGISITQNTVIDGNGNALLYSGTTYDPAQFRTGANNISITYKNLSFGNSTYPNSTWYGILYTGNSGVNFTVENINYTIKNGNQPFWGNNGSGNKLTFKGKNNFYSSGSSYGGEFVEGYPTVVFAEDSETTVYNDSPNATGVFYSTGQSVTVEKRASVSIESSKDYLFYNSATLNVQEQGKFSYKTIRGTNYSSNTATLCVGTLTANFANDSIGHFTTDVNSFTGSNPIVNLNSPDYVVFDATSSSKKVIDTMNPIFKRTDSDTSLYKIAYLTASGQNTYVPKVNSGSSYTVTSSNIGNGYSVAYAKMPSIEAPAVTAATGPDISNIAAQINNAAPATTLSSKVQYKLANKQLYSGDLAADAAQSSIEQAETADDGIIEKKELALPGDGLPIGDDTKHTFVHLPPGNYHVYAKANDRRVAGYTFESLWKESTAEVQPFIQVQFSSNAMSFNSPIPGQFGKQQNLDNYTIRNAGNVPTNINLTSITRNSDSSEKLSLVEQFDTNNQELLLSLIAEKAGSGVRTTFGPLVDKDPLSLDTLQLDPFWEADAQADLYLAGDYSGPMIGPQNFSYRFSFAISAVTTN